MFEIGGSLREARERRGLSLDEAQARTLVRSRYLRALEDERYDVLPGDFYIRIFLREYAEFLGLDGDVYVEEYLAQHPLEHEPLPTPRRSLRPRRLGVGRPAAVLAAGVVIVLAAWNLTDSSSTRQGLGGPSPAVAPTRGAAPPAPPPVAAATRRASSIVLSAARGPCWLLVRVGAGNGAVAYEGTLQTGQTVRFGLAKRLWIRLGAPWNVDATIGGRAATNLPPRIGDVLVSASGLSPA